jgi:nitrite reductase (NADH) large subunit
MGVAYQTIANDHLPDCLSNPLGARVLVIGAGPVGIRFANQLREINSNPCHIICFNGEAYPPYDRIKLTQLLTQQMNYADIFWPEPAEKPVGKNPRTSFNLFNECITAIDSDNKQVIDAHGCRYPYDYLVLATGSSPHIPQIAGVDLPGVYTFRNMRDVEYLLARTHRSRHTVVVGGGLLGLEATKGLVQKNTLVTLVHQAPRLMNRQLDDISAELLLKKVEANGIRVVTSDGLAEIRGYERVQSIVTRQGKTIVCDTVVLCTGIKPNTSLALQSGIKLNRGIVVDRHLRTSQRDVFAIGECAEFEGQLYGLVAPGLEQAAILADNLSGGTAEFSGSQPYTKLKVVDIGVNSLGEITELGKRPKLKILSHQHTTRQATTKRKTLTQTRSIALAGSKIIGACGVGEWTELQRIREAYQQRRSIYPWQQWLFKLTGKLWFTTGTNDPALWPGATIVCQCNQVNRATIETRINSGCTTIKAIGQECGAGSVCGSCQPVLQSLLQRHPPNVTEARTEKSKNLIPVATFSGLALLIVTALVLLPSVTPPDSVQDQSTAWLVGDKLFKQVSGFSLLAITLLGLILSLRKRLGWTFLGQFAHWRTVHAIAGVVALVVLFGHTGAHLGEQLNRWLMLNYLSVATIGALLGILIAVSRSNAVRDRFRRLSFWFHVVAVWPLPILISAHILSSYYF